MHAGTKVCWDEDPEVALETAHRLWGNEGLPGLTSQILPRPKDCAALMPLVPPEKVAESVACGPDADKHAAQVRNYIDADIDEVTCSRSAPTWRVCSRRGNEACCLNCGREFQP